MKKSAFARAESLGFSDLAAKAEFVSAAENAAELAVKMAREGDIDILMKGHLRTDQSLHLVLDKEKGLRTGRLLCDVAFFGHQDPGGARLVGITDGGLNPAPTLAQKKQIVLNAIDLLGSMGIRRPRIAIMSAVEVVSEAMPSTMDAKALTEMGAAGEFGEAEVFGPLALDNALLARLSRRRRAASHGGGRSARFAPRGAGARTRGRNGGRLIISDCAVSRRAEKMRRPGNRGLPVTHAGQSATSQPLKPIRGQRSGQSPDTGITKSASIDVASVLDSNCSSSVEPGSA